MNRRQTIVLLVLGAVYVVPTAHAGEKELAVPKEGLKIEGTVKRDDPKVAVIDPDPKVKGLDLPAKSYLVKLSAKKVYRINMIAADQSALDAFLVIQDLQGKQVGFDDDSGGGLNARLYFTPPLDGTYKVFAAALESEGKYTLRITEEEPVKGKLLGGDAQRVLVLEATSANHLYAGEFDKALELSRAVLAVREKLQGTEHWETVNARAAMNWCQQFADLPRDKQKSLAPACQATRDGLELRSRRQDAGAEAPLHKALDIYREVVGEKHPLTARSYNELARILEAQNKLLAALPLAQKALDIRRELLGEKHPDTALSYNDVARILSELRQRGLAQPLYQKALDICREVLGEKHPDTAMTYNELAFNLYAMARYAAAQPLFQKALEIRLELLGENDAETAQSCNNVAANLADQGQYAAAQPYYQKALDIRRELFGEKHPETGTSYNNMGKNTNALGQYAAAQQLFQKALDINRAVLGEKHPGTATNYNNLGFNLFSEGHYAAAQPLFEKAFGIRLAVLGEKHPTTANSYDNLAANLRAQGKVAAALPFNQKSLAICREVLGEKHPHTAVVYGELAMTLDAQGKYAAGQPLLQQALAIRQEVLGEKHPDTATGYNNLAANLAAQGKNAAAQPLFQRALDVHLAVLGAKHPLIAIDYHNMAMNLEMQDLIAAAQEPRQKALDIWREVLGEKHPSTANGYNGLAFNLFRQGRHAASRPLAQKALDIRREVLGANHLETGMSYQNMAIILHALSEFAEAEKLQRMALHAYDVSRIDRAGSGFERAFYAIPSARMYLAALLARRGAFVEAWQQAETDLARTLLDDASTPSDQFAQDPKTRLALLHKLDERLLPLLADGKLDATQKDLRADLLRQRQELLDALSTYAAKEAVRHVLPLDTIQSRLPADAALVLWIDAGPDTWGCVLRRDGPPRWELLAGSGPQGAWTPDDRNLFVKLYPALAMPNQVPDEERKRLMDAFVKQRFAPLHKHLQADGKLPAVRKLLVVPTGALAYVPLEALLSEYTISYVPSGSVFARLAQQHRPLQASPLLALGDPVFSVPSGKAAPPPAEGLLVQLVLPQSNAAKAGLQAGDVLLRYNDQPLKTLADVKIVADGPPVKVLYWREGKEEITRLQSGKLGVALDKRPAPEAVAAWRATTAMTTALRSTGHQPLPASRFEVQALSGLVGEKQTTLLLGSEASEQALDRLGKDGLKRFRILHLATHGDVDLIDPYRSALILAQDHLLDGLEAFHKGQKVYDGRLTVATILREWELDADLVVLSACQTALGKDAQSEGLLGFAQAFLQKGARSVVLSRWKVDDTATALFMLRFYENALGKREGLKAPLGRAAALDEARHWLRGLGRADAEKLAVGLTGGVLRGTERDLPPLVNPLKANLPAGARPFAHPFYWASFVLVGDPD